MGHNLEQLGTASLDTFGGLITNCNPSDLPEGASPRTWDTDFIVGSVFTRAGLSSVYTYTSTLIITGFLVEYNVATFTYAGAPDPVVNEGFLLNGFTGNLSFLNGQTVVVVSVDTLNKTFTADVTSASQGPFTGLNATASSTTGQFTGPNVPTAVSVVGTGNEWVAPSNILGNVAYASVTTGSAANSEETPGSATSVASPNTAFTSPGNITVSGASVASVTLTGASSSAPILAQATIFAIPSNAIVVGLSVAFAGKNTAVGTGSLSLQLATNGNAIGTPVSQPLGTTTAAYTAGSDQYQWGTTLTPDIVNGSALGILVTGKSVSGVNTITANGLTVTVYYSTDSSSQVLKTTQYVFSIPLTSGISGLGISFQAYSSADTVLSFRFAKNNVATGTSKNQALTTTPTIYSLGSPFDLWGTTWTANQVNNIKFGVEITASGGGTSFINDLDVLAYLTPALVNFNYVKTYVQNDGQIDTLALDASGLLWVEDVTNNPGVLTIGLTGILPGSFAKSATTDNQEFIMFSDLTIGTDRPRVFNGTQFLPLSQVGPGAPPAFTAASGTGSSTTLSITHFSITSDVVTFTFTAGPTVTASQVYRISKAVPSYLNIVGEVLSSPPPTGTTFSMAIDHADASGDITATGTLLFNYPINSITQPAQQSGFDGGVFWGAGPGPTHSPGSNLVLYYSQTEDKVLTTYFAAHPTTTYVYLGSINNFPQFSNQTYLITSVGQAKPSGTAGAARFYFVVNVGVSGASYPDGTTGTYQQTIATVTTAVSVPDISAGTAVQITGETPIAWNSTWSIVEALNSAVLDITATQMSSTGVATYQYSVPVGGANPVNGQTASITGCTNSAAGYTFSPFNVIGVIVVPGSLGAGSFDIKGFSGGLPIPLGSETGQASTFGTQFTIDPGALTLGTNTNPIYGNAGPSSASGGLFPVGSAPSAITPGTRQGVVFFITDSGYETAPSPPIVFTVPENSNSIYVTNIPIGPPNVKARGISFTEAGQNGVPGANFYVIETAQTVQVLNSAPLVCTPTIVNDNISTSAVFTFTDAVLLNSREIDVQGDDLFNLIELGSSAWCVPYALRMFYGLQLNKVQNFLNLTYDGGYLPSATGGNISPLGWQAAAGVTDFTLLVSPVTGNSLYVNNTTGATIVNAGLLFQSAYQDAYNVPIIEIGTTYSVRVAARNPSGVTGGVLTIQLVNYTQAGTTIASQFANPWGTFSVPLTSMTTDMQVFTGTLLTTPFNSIGGVPPTLVLSVQVKNLAKNADVEIDRIEVFPTAQPFLKPQVFGSYVNSPESIDGSSTGGIIDTTSENPQPCNGGFVMHDNLYLLKSASMYSTEENTNSEPGGWGLHEVSNKVGTIGIHSYDVGEEWMVTACRSGIFGFNGGQPIKFMQELWNLWETIYWNAGSTIVLRNDIVNKRILCAIPLPTGTSPSGIPTKTVQWLPNAPYNPTPTTPNIILMLNYQGMSTFEELMSGAEVHTTMFGSLAAVDMRRKWSLWQIPTPYMDFITRQNGIDAPLFICNGIDSSKIYQLLQEQLSDDGVAINSLYTTYGFVNATKAATLPIFGFHAKRYTVLQGNILGAQDPSTGRAGSAALRLLPNTISPKYPYTVPLGIPLSNPVQDDFFRSINTKGNRMFVEISTNAVGSWFNASKLLITGKADPWSTLNPTGGGNAGISA